MSKNALTILGVSLCLLGSLWSCTADMEETTPYPESTLINGEEGSATLEEVTMSLAFTYKDPATGTVLSLVANQLDSVEILFDGVEWARVQSLSFIGGQISDDTLGNYAFSNTFFEFPIISKLQRKVDNFDNAGDYVNLLSGDLTLTPGHYYVQINKAWIKDVNGETKVLYPAIIKEVDLKANTKVLDLGHLVAIIKKLN